MGAQLGSNIVTWFVIFPLLIIIAVGIVWFIVKLQATPWKRTGIAVASLFAFVGFAAVLLGLYYHVNSTFAESFKFYGYSALAPKGNPFQESDGYTGRILMTREVLKKDRQVNLLNHPNPASPTEVSMFTPGQYIQAQIQDAIVAIPTDTSASLPRVIKTSLWWALTKDLSKINQTAE